MIRFTLLSAILCFVAALQASAQPHEAIELVPALKKTSMERIGSCGASCSRDVANSVSQCRDWAKDNSYPYFAAYQIEAGDTFGGRPSNAVGKYRCFGCFDESCE